MRLFVADVWRDFEQAGMPIERWPEVNEAIERLRRLATRRVSAAFEQRLSARIDDAFELDRRACLTRPCQTDKLAAVRCDAFT